MTDFSIYRDVWKQESFSASAVPSEYPGWPEAGIAVMGDFAGIQNFVFRPVPGAGGAARRLRSRSFRVSAYSEMIMRWCLQQLSEGQPKSLYSAGGKFLIGAKGFEGWESRIRKMQFELDDWAWKTFNGELVFHLAASIFDSGKIPNAALQDAMASVRSRPLERALLSGDGWSIHEFFRAAAEGDSKCDACGMTRRIQVNADDESVCDGCIDDATIGKKLPRSRFAHISTDARADLSVLGTTMDLCETPTGKADGEWLAFHSGSAEASPWHLFLHMPVNKAGMALTFEEIAAFSPGTRKWIGYLRIDGDGAGSHFSRLDGHPKRTWALSRLLNLFFADTANQLVSHTFKNIYPVYGGGDDLFVVGPWTEVLDFALKLRQELTQIVGNDLTFSAGLSLAKPREHVLTQANMSLMELDSAKKEPGPDRQCGRDQIRALGVTADWDTFAKVLDSAKRVTRWAEDKVIPSSFLHQLLRLHNAWRERRKELKGKVTGNLVRYRPLLYYQIERNLKQGDAREWAHGLLQNNSLWPWADFIARYAMLAAQREETKE